MKKGFTNSIGCKRKKNKSNQRFEPLTSTPIKGTINNSINKIIKMGKTDFFTIFKSKKDIKNITKRAIITNNKCLEKKKIIIFIQPFSSQRGGGRK